MSTHDNRYIGIDEPDAAGLIAHHLKTLQARSRVGNIDPEDCQLYIDALDRARAYVAAHPELGIDESNLQLIMSGGSSTGTNTIIKLEQRDGQTLIALFRGTGWSSRTCRIEVPPMHPFRQIKPKPKEISSRGGSYFLDWVWDAPAPATNAPIDAVFQTDPGQIASTTPKKLWKCRRCDQNFPVKDDEHVVHGPGRVTIPCSSALGMGTETGWDEVDPPDPEQLAQQARRERWKYSKSLGATVTKLRSVDQVLLNVTTCTNLQDLVAILQAELARTNPRLKVVNVIHERLGRLVHQEPNLLFQLAALTDVDVIEERHLALLRQRDMSQVETALAMLRLELKTLFSIRPLSDLEMWLRIRLDELAGFEHPASPLEAAIEQVLSGKPTGVDPETAPYTLILSRRPEDAAWDAPDWIGVYRDKGSGEDVIAELKRSVTTGGVSLVSCDQDIPEYLLHVARYLTAPLEHHKVPWISQESQDLAESFYEAPDIEPMTPEDEQALVEEIVGLSQLAMDAFAGDNSAAAELAKRAELEALTWTVPRKELPECPGCLHHVATFDGGRFTSHGPDGRLVHFTGKTCPGSYCTIDETLLKLEGRQQGTCSSVHDQTLEGCTVEGDHDIHLGPKRPAGFERHPDATVQQAWGDRDERKPFSSDTCLWCKKTDVPTYSDLLEQNVVSRHVVSARPSAGEIAEFEAWKEDYRDCLITTDVLRALSDRHRDIETEVGDIEYTARPARFIDHRVEPGGWFFMEHRGYTRCRGSRRTLDELRELAADQRPWQGFRLEILVNLGMPEPYRTTEWVEAPDERWAAIFLKDRKRLSFSLDNTRPMELWKYCVERSLFRVSRAHGDVPTSVDRWKALRDRGADDVELLEEIRKEWGKDGGGQTGGPRGTVGYICRSGKAPYVEAWLSGEKNPVRVVYGHELVTTAREILDIPNPSPLTRIKDYSLPKPKKINPAEAASAAAWEAARASEVEREKPLYDLYGLPVRPGSDILFRCPCCDHPVSGYGTAGTWHIREHSPNGNERFAETDRCAGGGHSLLIAHLVAKGEYPPVLELPDPPEIQIVVDHHPRHAVLSERCLLCDFPVEVDRDLDAWPETFNTERYRPEDHNDGCKAAGQSVWHVFSTMVRDACHALGGISERRNGEESWKAYRQQYLEWRGVTAEDLEELERRRRARDAQRRQFEADAGEDLDPEECEPGENEGIDEIDEKDLLDESFSEEAIAAQAEASELAPGPAHNPDAPDPGPKGELPDPRHDWKSCACVRCLKYARAIQTSAEPTNTPAPTPTSAAPSPVPTSKKGKKGGGGNPNQLSLF